MPFASALPRKPFLTLYSDASESEEPPPLPEASLTLRQIWEQFVQPDLDEPAAKTLSDYRAVISHWEKLTKNPAISTIDRDLLREFQTKLLAGKNSRTGKRSAATVNKLFRCLRPLIVRCWPRDSHNPDGLGVCDYFRFPKALKWQKRIPRVLNDSDIAVLFEAAKAVTWSARQQPASTEDMFRAAMVLHFNCGPRTFDLLSWRCENIDWEFDRLGCTATVEFVAQKTGKQQRLPLNPTAANALRRIVGDRTTGFVWPGWQRSNSKQVRTAWRSICDAARVAFVMEDFRKTANTRHEQNRRGVGPWVLGHSVSGVNAVNYYDATDDVLKGMSSLPQPRCFLDWVN